MCYGPQNLCDSLEVQRFLKVWDVTVRHLKVPRTRIFKHIYDECFAQTYETVME